MSQATKQNTSKSITRRSMTTLVSLATIAGGAAAAAVMPARAGLSIGECTYPELAERLDSLYARWCAQREKDLAHSEEFDRRLAAAGYAERLCSGEPGWETYLQVFHETWKQYPDPDPVDEHGASIVWNEIHDELFPLVREIIRQPARSLLDLTLKARAIAVLEYQLWTDGEGESPDIGAVATRALIDDLCALAGIDVLPGIELVPFVTIDECP